MSFEQSYRAHEEHQFKVEEKTKKGGWTTKNRRSWQPSSHSLLMGNIPTIIFTAMILTNAVTPVNAEEETKSKENENDPIKPYGHLPEKANPTSKDKYHKEKIYVDFSDSRQKTKSTASKGKHHQGLSHHEAEKLLMEISTCADGEKAYQLFQQLKDNHLNHYRVTDELKLFLSTFLYQAISPAWNWSPERIEYVIKSGISANENFLGYFKSMAGHEMIEQEGMDTPLHLAIRFKRLDVAGLLIHLGADVNKPLRNISPQKNQTPLHRVIYSFEGKEKNDFLHLLLKANADANIPDSEGLTPYHYTLLNFDINTAEILLHQQKIDLNAPIKIPGKDNSLLTLFCMLRNKKNYNQQIIKPLTSNINNRFKEFIALNIKHGLDINQRNPQGETTLQYLLTYASDFDPTELEEIITALMEFGMDPFLENTHGYSMVDFGHQILQKALQKSEKYKNRLTRHQASDLAKQISNKKNAEKSYLLFKSYNENYLRHNPLTENEKQNLSQWLAYSILIWDWTPQQINEIIDAGADVNTNYIDFYNNNNIDLAIVQQYAYDTPLLMAIQTENLAVTELLLTKGASTNIRVNNKANYRHSTPLHIPIVSTRFSERERFVDLLLQYYAQPNGMDSEGKTPLHQAVEKGSPCENNEHIQRALLKHQANPEREDFKGTTPIDAHNPVLTKLLINKYSYQLSEERDGNDAYNLFIKLKSLIQGGPLSAKVKELLAKKLYTMMTSWQWSAEKIDEALSLDKSLAQTDFHQLFHSSKTPFNPKYVTPLQIAIHKNDLTVIRLLVKKYDASVKIALYEAASSFNIQILECLLESNQIDLSWKYPFKDKEATPLKKDIVSHLHHLKNLIDQHTVEIPALYSEENFKKAIALLEGRGFKKTSTSLPPKKTQQNNEPKSTVPNNESIWKTITELLSTNFFSGLALITFLATILKLLYRFADNSKTPLLQNNTANNVVANNENLIQGINSNNNKTQEHTKNIKSTSARIEKSPEDKLKEEMLSLKSYSEKQLERYIILKDLSKEIELFQLRIYKVKSNYDNTYPIANNIMKMSIPKEFISKEKYFYDFAKTQEKIESMLTSNSPDKTDLNAFDQKMKNYEKLSDDFDAWKDKQEIEIKSFEKWLSQKRKAEKKQVKQFDKHVEKPGLRQRKNEKNVITPSSISTTYRTEGSSSSTPSSGYLSAFVSPSNQPYIAARDNDEETFYGGIKRKKHLPEKEMKVEAKVSEKTIMDMYLQLCAHFAKPEHSSKIDDAIWLKSQAYFIFMTLNALYEFYDKPGHINENLKSNFGHLRAILIRHIFELTEPSQKNITLMQDAVTFIQRHFEPLYTEHKKSNTLDDGKLATFAKAFQGSALWKSIEKTVREEKIRTSPKESLLKKISKICSALNAIHQVVKPFQVLKEREFILNTDRYAAAKILLVYIDELYSKIQNILQAAPNITLPPEIENFLDREVIFNNEKRVFLCHYVRNQIAHQDEIETITKNCLIRTYLTDLAINIEDGIKEFKAWEMQINDTQIFSTTPLAPKFYPRAPLQQTQPQPSSENSNNFKNQ